MTGLIIAGGGGHARSCIDVILAEGRWGIRGIIERDGFQGSVSCGYTVLGTDSDLNNLVAGGTPVLIAVGQVKSANRRKALYGRLIRLGAGFPIIQSPNAYISSTSSVGNGTIVMHGAIVNAGSLVGQQCIVNSRATVEHDVVVGDFCHISTGALVNGGARIGEQSFIGSGAVIREGVRIGRQVVIGAGARVTTDLPDRAVFKGRN